MCPLDRNYLKVNSSLFRTGESFLIHADQNEIGVEVANSEDRLIRNNLEMPLSIRFSNKFRQMASNYFKCFVFFCDLQTNLAFVVRHYSSIELFIYISSKNLCVVINNEPCKASDSGV